MSRGRPVIALILVVLVATLAVAPAGAQAPTSPQPTATPQGPEPPITPPIEVEPGLCAPWHRCVAFGILGMIVLYLLATGAMYLYQRRGFDTVEHRQGNPEGVPSKK